jgi:hypothetical protein
MTGDLKDFYLGTDMTEYEYARILVHLLPASIITYYNLDDKIVDGYVYAECRKGMYGLPQAGKLANDNLGNFLKPHGYVPCPITHGLWKHLHSDLMFTLVVDDFGVRYTNKANTHHLMQTLKTLYRVSEDWAGERYIGLTLKWDYSKRTVNLSMPGYVERALQWFKHPAPQQPEHAPYAWTAPNYGARQQYTATHDNTPVLDAANTKHVQEVLGTLLYYARAVDNTMLVAIRSITTQQASATKATMRAITKLLNYCATHLNAVIRFYASGMCLKIESDASYLSESKHVCALPDSIISAIDPPAHPNHPSRTIPPSPPSAQSMSSATLCAKCSPALVKPSS